MEKFIYNAKCGNQFFCDITIIERRGEKMICNATMLHGRGGRSRWDKSYKEARWLKEYVEGIVLLSEHFEEGIKIVKQIEDYTNEKKMD